MHETKDHLQVKQWEGSSATKKAHEMRSWHIGKSNTYNWKMISQELTTKN